MHVALGGPCQRENIGTSTNSCGGSLNPCISRVTPHLGWCSQWFSTQFLQDPCQWVEMEKKAEKVTLSLFSEAESLAQPKVTFNNHPGSSRCVQTAQRTHRVSGKESTCVGGCCVSCLLHCGLLGREQRTERPQTKQIGPAPRAGGTLTFPTVCCHLWNAGEKGDKHSWGKSLQQKLSML